MAKVVFYGWKIDPETEKLFIRMSEVLNGLIPNDPAVPIIIDVAAYGEVDHDEGWGLAFGKAIKQVIDCNAQLIGMPDVELLTPTDINKTYRQAAMETIQTIAEYINNNTVDCTLTHVAIVKDGVSVGQADTDIIIPEGTLRYIQEIRDLLDGGAIEITKGDLKIEIKEKSHGANSR